MRVGTKENVMGWRARWIAAVGAGILLVLSSTAGAKALVIPPRPGQVGLSIEGQYGTFLDTGDMGGDFADGPGLAVRIRYRMRYERAIGLSFESQSFNVRPGTSFTDPFSGTIIPPDSSVAPQTLTWITWGPEFYQMFGTRTNTTRMLSAGLGLVSGGHLTLKDGETQYITDGYYLSAGAGVEHFFWRSWAWDLGARYMAVFHEGQTNHEFQAAAGIIVYASY
ncbi:MAG TPA: hypothetical protein VI792_09820 [Candidatus Eisenbacteria bacterium]